MLIDKTVSKIMNHRYLRKYQELLFSDNFIKLILIVQILLFFIGSLVALVFLIGLLWIILFKTPWEFKEVGLFVFALHIPLILLYVLPRTFIECYNELREMTKDD